MDPLKRKELLKNEILKNRRVNNTKNKPFIRFESFKVDIEPETFEWYRVKNGGYHE